MIPLRTCLIRLSRENPEVKNSKKMELCKKSITDMSGLDDFYKLEELNLSQNKISSIHGLKKMYGLKVLNLSHNKIKEISGLPTTLRTLRLGENNIREIKGLDKCFLLEELSLENNLLFSLTGLPNVGSSITKLFLSKNSISNLSGINKLYNLQVLALDENLLKSIKGLEGNTKLEFLNIGGNAIRKLTPLYGMKKLKSLLIKSMTELEILEINGMMNIVILSTFVKNGGILEFEETEFKYMMRLSDAAIKKYESTNKPYCISIGSDNGVSRAQSSIPRRPLPEKKELTRSINDGKKLEKGTMESKMLLESLKQEKRELLGKLNDNTKLYETLSIQHSSLKREFDKMKKLKDVPKEINVETTEQYKSLKKEFERKFNHVKKRYAEVAKQKEELQKKLLELGMANNIEENEECIKLKFEVTRLKGDSFKENELGRMGDVFECDQLIYGIKRKMKEEMEKRKTFFSEFQCELEKFRMFEKKLKVELENAKSEVSELGRENSVISSELKKVKSENSELKREKEIISNELKKVKNQKNKLSRDLKKVESENSELTRENEIISSELKKVKSESSELKEQKKKITIDLKKVKSEDKKLIKKNEELVNIVGELEKKMEDERKRKLYLESVFNFERSLVACSLKEFKFVEEIHRGQNGVVCRVTLGEKQLAMKIGYCFNQRLTLQIWRTLVKPEFLFRLPVHKNLLRLHYCGVGNFKNALGVDHETMDIDVSIPLDKNPYFIMPICDGTLQDLIDLKKTRPVFPKFANFLSFLVDISCGLCVMKNHKIIHRDVKPDNLMFNVDKESGNEWKTFLVGDYGCTYKDGSDNGNFSLVLRKDQHHAYTRGGAPMYMPPEVKNPKADTFRFDKYDVFSLGVVCFELFSSRDPGKSLKLRKKECSDKKIREMIKKMVGKYENRYSIEEVHEIAKELQKSDK